MTLIPYHPVSAYSTTVPSAHHLKPPSVASVRAKFLKNAISATYTLPLDRVLNLTMVEIITLLPNLYKEPPIAHRFINNHMTTAIHFAILSFHRDLNLASDAEETQVREIITESYRRAMRVWYPGWTKASHVAPVGWNPSDLSWENFGPVAMREKGYRAPVAVPFKRLMNGVKELPKGSDKGDLTCALEYTLAHAKVDGQGRTSEWMFPDDIHTILDLCGRTEVEPHSCDRRAVRRWADKVVSKKQQVAVPLPRIMAMQVPTSWEIPLAGGQHCGYAGHVSADTATGQMIAYHLDTADTTFISHIDANTYPLPVRADMFHEVDKLFWLPPGTQQQMVPPVWNQDIDTLVNGTSADMDDLLRSYLSQDLPEPDFLLPESGLLRDFPGPAVDDETDLASAVRFAKQPDQISIDWHFNELHVLAGLLKFEGTIEDDGWLDLD